MKQKGLKGLPGKAPVYEESLKIAIAREYLTGQLSFGQLAKKHHLPQSDTVRYFLNWYKQWLKKQNEPVPAAEVKNVDLLTLQGELQQANLRIAALEMLIQNAQKELGIDIIKKSGTKQPGK